MKSRKLAGKQEGINTPGGKSIFYEERKVVVGKKEDYSILEG